MVTQPKLHKLISENRLCKILDISKETLYGLRKKGCPWVKVGGRPFYYEDDLMNWLLKNSQGNKENGDDGFCSED